MCVQSNCPVTLFNDCAKKNFEDAKDCVKKCTEWEWKWKLWENVESCTTDILTCTVPQWAKNCKNAASKCAKVPKIKVNPNICDEGLTIQPTDLQNGDARNVCYNNPRRQGQSCGHLNGINVADTIEKIANQDSDGYLSRQCGPGLFCSVCQTCQVSGSASFSNRRGGQVPQMGNTFTSIFVGDPQLGYGGKIPKVEGHNTYYGKNNPSQRPDFTSWHSEQSILAMKEAITKFGKGKFAGINVVGDLVNVPHGTETFGEFAGIDTGHRVEFDDQIKDYLAAWNTFFKKKLPGVALWPSLGNHGKYFHFFLASSKIVSFFTFYGVIY